MALTILFLFKMTVDYQPQKITLRNMRNMRNNAQQHL